MIVHVIGASGRSGVALCRALAERSVDTVPVVRDIGRWMAAGQAGDARLADLQDAPALRAALSGATHVVSCAHARHACAILAEAPATASFVFLGSTRKCTRWPDSHGNGVLAGEHAFLASGRRGVMLHPTMIYGAQGENNVQRLAALIRRLPLMPLPGGGRALVQPIYQDDVTRAVLAALERNWSGPESLVIAGATAVPYAEFVRMVAAASGAGPVRIVNAPAWLLRLGAGFTSLIPGAPRVDPDEIRRLEEDKAFSVTPMIERLGIEPIGLRDGLSRMTWS